MQVVKGTPLKSAVLAFIGNTSGLSDLAAKLNSNSLLMPFFAASTMSTSETLALLEQVCNALPYPNKTNLRASEFVHYRNP